ncbi:MULTISPECIES: hypothetical protein [Novosphingobium]|nr:MULTISPECIES: hypothetical protein [Novosphingobium]CDO38076.1 hypothetical protein SPHV1_50043 [Novosphingobium sp. KN65.2]SLJ97199.1 hypothetical protein SAMN06295987_102803 [Novosphingobium mathurense]
MTPEIAGMRISRSIKSVETGMDELLAMAGELLAEIARGRIATTEDAYEGQRPMMRVANMQRNLMEARSELVRAHSDLSKLAERMDIPYECPDNRGELRDLDLERAVA